jgi:hypothetical protein
MRRFLEIFFESTDPTIRRVINKARKLMEFAKGEDRQYLENVVSQDWDRCQEMVRSEAIAAGYQGPIFHGSKRGRFNKGRIDIGRTGENYGGWAQMGDGFYLHSNPKTARSYGSYVHPFFVKLKNPYRGRIDEFEDYGGDNSAFISKLRERGHDSIIIDEVEGDSFVVFEPKCLKYGGVISEDPVSDSLVLLSDRFNTESENIYL